MAPMNIDAILALVFFSMSFPWNPNSDKNGWNSKHDQDMLLNSGDLMSSSRRKTNSNGFGVPCGICGQLVFGREALTYHYNYHFLQNQLPHSRSSSSSSSQPSTASTSPRPPTLAAWRDYFHGRASTSREAAAMQNNNVQGRQQQPRMTPNNQLAQRARSHSVAANSAAAVNNANQLPLHPLLAQLPRNDAGVQPGQGRVNVNQGQYCSNGNGGLAGGRPMANQQPPQDVIDLKDDENDCSSDSSDGLDLTLSL